MTQKINLSFQYDAENNLKMVFGNLYQVIDWVVLIVKKQCIWKSQGQSSQRSLHLMSCWQHLSYVKSIFRLSKYYGFNVQKILLK